VAAGNVAERAAPTLVQEAVTNGSRSWTVVSGRPFIVAAVIGERFEFDLLRRTSGLEEADVVDALRARRGRRSSLTTSDMRRTHSFSDMRLCAKPSFKEPLARERRLLHQRVAGALEQSDEQTVDYPRLHTTTNKQVTVNAHLHSTERRPIRMRGAVRSGGARALRTGAALAPDDDARSRISRCSFALGRGLGRRAQCMPPSAMR